MMYLRMSDQTDNWQQWGLSLGIPSLCKGVLGVADFDGPPVAGSYEADQTQEVSEGPRNIGSMVATGKVLSAHLKKVLREW